MTAAAGARGRRHPRALRRATAAVLLGTVIATGLGVHLLAPDTALTDIAGDVLYALAAYLVVAILLPRAAPLVIGSIAVTWCITVELFQLTGVPVAAAESFPPAVLVLGTVFDPRDLGVYVVTVVAAVGCHLLVRLARSRDSPQAEAVRAGRMGGAC